MYIYLSSFRVGFPLIESNHIQVLGSITSLVINLKGNGKLYTSNKPPDSILGVSEEDMKKIVYTDWMSASNKVNTLSTIP